VCLNASAITGSAPGNQDGEELDGNSDAIKADFTRPIPPRPDFRCSSSYFLVDFPGFALAPQDRNARTPDMQAVGTIDEVFVGGAAARLNIIYVHIYLLLPCLYDTMVAC
jgi:hypothetical protein